MPAWICVLARKSAWDVGLTVGSLFVLCLKKNGCCLAWPWPSLYRLLFPTTIFSARSHSHWLGTSFCVWEHDRVPVHKCKPRLHANTPSEQDSSSSMLHFLHKGGHIDRSCNITQVVDNLCLQAQPPHEHAKYPSVPCVTRTLLPLV